MKLEHLAGLSSEQLTLLAELVKLLRKDSRDEAAAEYLLGLCEKNQVTAEIAQALYAEAVRLVYFTNEHREA